MIPFLLYLLDKVEGCKVEQKHVVSRKISRKIGSYAPQRYGHILLFNSITK